MTVAWYKYTAYLKSEAQLGLRYALDALILSDPDTVEITGSELTLYPTGEEAP